MTDKWPTETMIDAAVHGYDEGGMPCGGPSRTHRQMIRCAIVEALAAAPKPDDNRIRELEAKNAELKTKLKAVTGLLKAARCPNCDGSGTMLVSGSPEPCQWCDELEALLKEKDDECL